MLRNLFISFVFWVLFSANLAQAATITLALNPNSTTEPAGYMLYYGSESKSKEAYTSKKDLGRRKKNVPFDVTFKDLEPGKTYCFAATAYIVTDGSRNESSFSAEVCKTVPPKKGLNNPPSAAADSATTNEDVSVTIDVLANDTDIDGDILSIASVIQPVHGATQISAGKIIYTPAANYNGADSFSYTVSDGKGGTATGTVMVTVNSVNHPPVANAGVDKTVYEGDTVSLNATGSSDPDSGIASYLWVQTGGPSVSLLNPATATPAFTAPPVTTAGASFTFQLTVTDNGGLSDTDTVVIAVIDKPVPPQTSPIPSTVYEDGEDGTTKGWYVYDNDPAGATITNVYDSTRQSRVIKLQGSGTDNGYRLCNDNGRLWRNNHQFVIQWDLKFSKSFVVYVDVQTTAGHRYLYYTAIYKSYGGTGGDVHHGIGAAMTDGQWHTVVRDLQADLEDAQPGVTILEVNGFLVRGSGMVDDIELLDSVPVVYENAEDGATTGWTIYDANPAGATITNVFDSTRQSRVIELKGAGTTNGYWLKNVDGSQWYNNTQFVLQWSMKFSEVFNVFVDVQTTAGHQYLYYSASDTSSLGTGAIVHHGIGAAMTDGKWHTVIRNLQADLEDAQPGVTILEVNGFLVRGSGLVDDVKTY